jgi:predicted dehydrogenase
VPGVTEKVGVGIIGCGVISETYLRLAPLFKGLELRLLADILPAASARRADEFGVRAVSVEDLLAAPEIDMVVNLTPPEAHYPVMKSILEAGKHAYGEKPLVLTLEQGEDLRRISEAKGLRVGSAPDTFLGGSHQLARRLLDDGQVGAVVAGTAHVMTHGMEHWHPNPDFFFLPGAGPVLDVGPYYITNLIQLLGPVRRVVALASSATPTRRILTEGPRRDEVIPVKTPTNIHALMEFRSGATIAFSASWDVWAHRHPNMDLYGMDGSLFVPDPNFFGGLLQMAGRDGVVRDVETWDHPFGIDNQSRPGRPRVANYRTAGLADMAQALAEGRPHRCSLELCLHAVDVMTGILRAGETGAFVEMSTTCERPAALGPAEARALLA